MKPMGTAGTTANSCFFTFGFVHPMLDEVLGITESDQIAIH
jgi:hypothetical protein